MTVGLQLWLDFTVFHFEHTTSIKTINLSGIITIRKRQFFTNINTWSLGGLYIINISWGLRFREFWKTNSSIVPKFLTVMTRGLPSSTEVSMTLITVHTTPVVTCSSPEIDSRVLVSSCPVASRLSRHVPFWWHSQSVAPLPGPPSRHCVKIFNSPLQQQNCWGTGHRVLSQEVSTPDSVTSYRGAVDGLAPMTGD